MLLRMNVKVRCAVSGVESSSECVPPCLMSEVNHRVVIRTPLGPEKPGDGNSPWGCSPCAV